jgi:hypothetical protein
MQLILEIVVNLFTLTLSLQILLTKTAQKMAVLQLSTLTTEKFQILGKEYGSCLKAETLTFLYG